ncbi:MAG: O-antigen ligase domain-containing protein [Leptolyngbyaceae cyanobacterium MO_188.B28]|nr:O-antigen ligase domain-containing protein [Leptolyngbyaceae cyanobacterium MO_188.B28]
MVLLTLGQLKKDFQQTKPAWNAILGFSIFLALCFLVGAGRILVPLFPLGAIAVGVYLYRRYPVFYVGFTWWLWFLGPLIRRLIDYQSGHYTYGPWILTPKLVTLICAATFVRYLPRCLNQHGLPFILCIVSVCYGFAIGAIQNPLNVAVLDFFGWIGPIFFSFHLYVHWREYPNYRQSIQQTFLWGVLVMGGYGVWQYLTAPAWDKFWLTTEVHTTYGVAEPLGIRVWSTMMIPQTFGAVMIAGLLLLFVHKGVLRFLAAAFGYLSFLLTIARAAWLGWFVTLLIFLPSIKLRLQVRLVVSILAVVMLVLPLATVEPFSSVIGDRFQSFSDPTEDVSYQARLGGLSELIGAALVEFLGRGLGTQLPPTASRIGPYDNGLLLIIFSLGWFAAIAYLTGIGLLFTRLLQGSNERSDAFASAARAIALGSFLVQLGFNPVTMNSFAMVVWGFLGIGMAANNYAFYQRTASLKRV